MAKTDSKSGTGFFKQLKDALSGRSKYRQVWLDGPLALDQERLRIPCVNAPMELSLGGGGKRLHLIPEPHIDGDDGNHTSRDSFIIYDPTSYFSGIHGFLRLTPGDTLVLGREDDLQRAIFSFSKQIDKRLLSIGHDGEALLFRGLSAEANTGIAPLEEAEKIPATIPQRRQHLLEELRIIYGGPIEHLEPQAALETLQQVNELLEKEPCRPHDSLDNPGGVVRLPDKMIPIIIGDLHAQVDNLLTLLTQNEFLEWMGDGKATLIFLGDAVHKEVDGEMEEMESSILIMDLIFRLKLWFPQQIFYIRGNHDCFTEEIGKSGIPQGLLWDHAISKTRGKAYKAEMDRFYRLLPYVAVSHDFAACHAGPPKSKVSLDLLIDVQRYPGLIRELTCNRPYAPNRPAGYTKGDVKRLRNALDLPQDAPLFVGHTPLDRSDTLWLDVGGISNHHVVFSGNTPWIGVFTRVGGRMVPLRYRMEHLLPIINAMEQPPET